jgi:uncharacterized coiled-coil DUF342 family protein
MVMKSLAEHNEAHARTVAASKKLREAREHFRAAMKLLEEAQDEYTEARINMVAFYAGR